MTWDDVRTPEGGETSETDSRWRGKRVAVHTRTAPACLDARSPYSRRLYALGTDGLDASKTGNRRRVPKGVYYNVHNRGQGALSPYYDADKPSGLFEGVLPIKIRVLDNVGFTKLDHVAH